MVVIGVAPANIAVLGFLQERGSFTIHGVSRFALIILQAGLAIYLLETEVELSERFLDPFKDPLASVLVYLPYHQMPALLLILSGLASLTFLGLHDSPINQGMASALIGLVLAQTIPATNAWEIFLIAGSLYLGASIIRDSYNMAYRDELTGLPHRRALNELFLSLGNKYSVAMIDVDHFKKFNDTHGHDVGDQVLQMVAMKIQQVGGGGKAYRYGGEEFSVVFPRMTKDEAHYHLDETRKAIQNYEMVIRDKPREDEKEEKKEGKKHRKRGSFRTASTRVSVTVSIGVADKVGTGLMPDEVLKEADKALYAAKKGGRNQVLASK